jgi:hypothetical protein
MQSAKANRRGPRLTLAAGIIAASITLTGCSAIIASLEPVTESPTATTSTSAGYVYTDTDAGYIVTFPGEPQVNPLAISGTDRFAHLVGYSGPSTIGLISRGELRDSPPSLRGELFGWLQSLETTGQIGASSDELGGLSALRAEFTLEGDQDGETVVASDGNRFFQLIAIDGTPEERQAFFDSFRLAEAE